MLYTTDIRLSRYIFIGGLINQNKINQINDFLQNHTLQQFKQQVIDFDKNNWFYCQQELFYLTALANYKTCLSKIKINYSIQHLKQLLKIVQEKYFDKLHILITMIEEDFLLYSEYVQLMLKYMLDSDIKLSDCIIQYQSNKNYLSQLNYKQFIPLIQKMLTYCKNKHLRQEVQQKILKRIRKIIDKKQDKLKLSLQPIHFY